MKLDKEFSRGFWELIVWLLRQLLEMTLLLDVKKKPAALIATSYHPVSIRENKPQKEAHSVDTREER